MLNAKAALALAVCSLALAACNGDGPSQSEQIVTARASLSFTQADQDALSAASCADADAFITPQSIDITAAPLAFNADLEGAELNGLRFAGGWHLTSDEPNFGGLSGLAVHPKDHLLAISDSGAFIWLSMLDNAPSGFGAIAYMRDETGRTLEGKTAADSEGLALVDGLALVSFERDHRVLAYDLANCGAAANGALVTNIPQRPPGLGRTIAENQGAEALMLSTNQRLIAGLEIKASKHSAPLGDISRGAVQFGQSLPRPSDKRLVGLDALEGTYYALFRAYSPISGNSIDIHAHTQESPEPTIIAQLKRPFPVDNFEGITATRLPDGTVRLYIISDDNFSQKQRTLLLAFDLTPAAP